MRLIGRIDKRARRASVRAAAAVPWYREDTRPLLIGASVGHVRVTAGTIGAFVRRGERVFLLSNNHVLAASNEASIGDFIRQPGPAALPGEASGDTALRARAGSIHGALLAKTIRVNRRPETSQRFHCFQ